MTKTSYLVAAIGVKSAVLAQCFAHNANAASKAVSALFLDEFGEPANEVKCIDKEATTGLWLPSDPHYLRRQIASVSQL